MNIEKMVEIGLLFEQYKELLTDKQREIVSLYYEEDYSLGEISENLNISRSAVGNTVKIVEGKLSKYESVLHIKEKNEKLMELSEKLEDENLKGELEKIIS